MPFIISWFLWVRNPGMDQPGPLAQGLSQVAIKSSQVAIISRLTWGNSSPVTCLLQDLVAPPLFLAVWASSQGSSQGQLASSDLASGKNQRDREGRRHTLVIWSRKSHSITLAVFCALEASSSMHAIFKGKISHKGVNVGGRGIIEIHSRNCLLHV